MAAVHFPQILWDVRKQNQQMDSRKENEVEQIYIDARVQFCRPFLGVSIAEVVQYGLE